jgi:hypothetical protein
MRRLGRLAVGLIVLGCRKEPEPLDPPAPIASVLAAQAAAQTRAAEPEAVPVPPPEPELSEKEQRSMLKSLAAELRGMLTTCAAPRARGLDRDCMALLRSSHAKSAQLRIRLDTLPKNLRGWIDVGTASQLIDNCCSCSEQGASLCPKVKTALDTAAREMR